MRPSEPTRVCAWRREVRLNVHGGSSRFGAGRPSGVRAFAENAAARRRGGWGRRGRLRHPPLAQDDAPRAEGLDEVHVMSGDHHRHPHFVEAFEQLHDFERELRI